MSVIQQMPVTQLREDGSRETKCCWLRSWIWLRRKMRLELSKRFDDEDEIDNNINIVPRLFSYLVTGDLVS